MLQIIVFYLKNIWIKIKSVKNKKKADEVLFYKKTLLTHTVTKLVWIHFLMGRMVLKFHQMVVKLVPQ